MPAPDCAPGPLGLTVEITIHSGREAAALEHLHALAEHSRREPGCLVYNVFRAQDHASRFLIYELYHNAAALDAHHATAHFATHATAGLTPLIAERRYQLWDSVAVL